MSAPDPSGWLDRHGDYLFRYALTRLRDEAQAEDLVQETLLAALRGREAFAGRSSERTWLVGILKHKLIDHFRRGARETPAGDLLADVPAHDEFFRDSGEWAGHWEAAFAPGSWELTPATALERAEFWEVLDGCLGALSERAARAFMLRELDGCPSEEICEVLGVSRSNLWVLLHRARLQLRRCVGAGWFREGVEQ
jgi:RNA polymerase sigma-70 factor (ECF subfamily)